MQTLKLSLKLKKFTMKCICKRSYENLLGLTFAVGVVVVVGGGGGGGGAEGGGSRPPPPTVPLGCCGLDFSFSMSSKRK